MQLTCNCEKERLDSMFVKNSRWILALLVAPPLFAVDAPFFVTYSHRMEEPGSLEIALSNVIGKPEEGNRFTGSLMEIEYGVKAWWTTEFYLDGQTTRNDSTIFTGYRWESRVRPLMGEHWINPVLYFEFSNLNGGDKTLREIVGHDSQFDQAESNAETRLEKKREIETKLILSSNFKGWNVSENLIAEKNLSNQPWEFGYAVSVARGLGLKASPRPCHFCRENFRAGVEFYGGVGTRHEFGLRETSHYVAPALAWQVSNGTIIRVSPSFGLTDESHRFLFRFGVSYEISAFGRQIRRMYR